MEEDRVATNLGPDISSSLEKSEPRADAKLPKRRFIGKRAATQRASTNGTPNDGQDGNIEDSGAIQSMIQPASCSMK